ncbi:hypothetical protein Nepgr_007338 [Nepenthes gracilis]|uniref:Uncharacterized protein n=1 Tax=Nepenthes gracilis TaxID=150966 RepID=A0AAD3S6V4_NEPGR|nr:hypothetical protein Nepgr_007338 [Nepenthes gracilis]
MVMGFEVLSYSSIWRAFNFLGKMDPKMTFEKVVWALVPSMPIGISPQTFFAASSRCALGPLPLTLFSRHPESLRLKLAPSLVVVVWPRGFLTIRLLIPTITLL